MGHLAQIALDVPMDGAMAQIRHTTRTPRDQKL